MTKIPKEHPLLYTGEMVRATLEGRKDVTRRVILPQPEVFDRAGQPDFTALTDPKKHWKPGDLIYVREGWRCTGGGDLRNIIYRAEGDSALSFCGVDDGRKSILKVPEEYWSKWDYYVYESKIGCEWRPSIHLPKWATRLWLEIVSKRAERLQEITLKDVCREGLAKSIYEFKPVQKGLVVFEQLWDSINKKRGYGWDTNPWVWRIENKIITYQ